MTRRKLTLVVDNIGVLSERLSALRDAAALAQRCDYCHAEPGDPCIARGRYQGRVLSYAHTVRSLASETPELRAQVIQLFREAFNEGLV